MNSEQVFKLIDTILPFEVCIYHQVIPLSMEGSRINLGMVEPQDSAALSYVRQLLGYLKCSLVPRPISSEEHQSTLSAYLNYTNQDRSATQPNRQSAIAPKSKPKSSPKSSDVPKPPPPPLLRKIADTQSTGQSERPPDVDPGRSLRDKIPNLELRAQYLASPIEALAALPPSQLLDELLGRVLMGGIGRLFFERQEQNGRILWSRDGVLQSALESLSLPTFQGTINELKRLTNLPMIPVQDARQVEIERMYQKTHLLLRLRVMRGQYGEEATLQVLRGAALKFYQQQKIADLSHEALMLAQQLQGKLGELRDRSTLHPYLSGHSLEMLPALEEIFARLDREMQVLRTLQTTQE